MAISDEAGPTLASSSAVVEPLLDMLGAKRISESEELVTWSEELVWKVSVFSKP